MKRLLYILILLYTSVTYSADIEVISNPAIEDIDGGVTYISNDNMITVNMPTQNIEAMPSYVAATVVAQELAFKGNYIEAGVKTLTFLIKSELSTTNKAGIMIILKGKDGRMWINETAIISSQAGLWITNNISFDRILGGWTRDPRSDSDITWQEDLQNVDLIGIRLNQQGIEQQSYSISNFILIGTTITLPAVLTPLETAIKEVFNVTSTNLLTDEQTKQDTDKDGMTDIIEILSEHDDVYAASIFVSDLAKVDENGVLLRWPCVINSFYTILRSDSLLSPFSVLTNAVQLKANQTGYMTHLDTTVIGEGPYFYKIRKD